MAVNLDGGGQKGPISEINVTPLVDVMLVLLVIFMITAPLMLNGISLQLPRTGPSRPVKLTAKQVILSFTRTGEYFLGKDKILQNELLQAVKGQMVENKTDTVFLRADFAIRYGQVAKLIGLLKGGGISNIALVTEIEGQ